MTVGSSYTSRVAFSGTRHERQAWYQREAGVSSAEAARRPFRSSRIGRL